MAYRKKYNKYFKRRRRFSSVRKKIYRAKKRIYKRNFSKKVKSIVNNMADTKYHLVNRSYVNYSA